MAAVNLRPAVSSVGPIADQIQLDVLAGPLGAGFLVSVPVLLFGLSNPLVQWATRKWDLNAMILLSLAVLSCAIVIRSALGVPGIIVGTILVGASIAYINIALPAVIRSQRDSTATATTGVYSASLSIGAAVAAGMTVPLSHVLGLDWQMTLALWSVPALIAALFWLQMPRTPRETNRATAEPDSAIRPSRSLGIWMIVGFFGCQSMLYYTVTTWLPAMLEDHGVDPLLGGTLLSIINSAGIPASFLVPYLCRFRPAAGYLAVTCGILWATGLAFTVYSSATILGAVIIGIAQGASLSLGLTMIVLASTNGAHALAVSGTVQGFGYTLAAIGPFLWGALIVVTGSWAAAKIGLFGVIILMLILGVVAAARISRRRLRRGELFSGGPAPGPPLRRQDRRS